MTAHQASTAAEKAAAAAGRRDAEGLPPDKELGPVVPFDDRYPYDLKLPDADDLKDDLPLYVVIF